ncbi:MAG: Fe-S cluster assembly sulfur transfer protein SufU [Bryobacteraceae bacterium]|jgi:nitrogen fixation protein NifU and related proteins
MLADLYQEVILDHSKRPRNFHHMDDATRNVEGYNPLCGDKLKLFVKLDGETVQDISFVGAGCAISTASASLMTETVKGKSRQEAVQMMEIFHDLLTTDKPASPALGKLAVFSGVREFPVRVKCATLAWHTLKSALAGAGEVVSTE